MNSTQQKSALWTQLLTRERVIHATFLTLLVALAWTAMVYASAGSSWGRELSHHYVLGDKERPLATATPLFLAAWVVMSAAMMLPTVWPVLDRFTNAARLQSLRAFLLLMALFAGGYLVVWGLFGLAAFGGDVGLHRLVEALDPPKRVEEFLGPGMLLLAGVYQFTPLKWACMSQCQSPVSFLVRHWRPGPKGALVLGVRHGLYCLGCCWALMLLMFGVGLTNLGWMLGLAVLFYIEKVVARGMSFSRATGLLFLALGVLMAAGIIPSSFSS